MEEDEDSEKNNTLLKPAEEEKKVEIQPKSEEKRKISFVNLAVNTRKRNFIEDSIKTDHNFIEDSIKTDHKAPNEGENFSLSSKKVIKPMIVQNGFEEISDYKLDKFDMYSASSLGNKSFTPEKRSPLEPVLMKLAHSNTVGTGTPSPNHLRSEIRFYNDALLIISILLEAFQALIEEMKLPSSKIVSVFFSKKKRFEFLAQ